MFERTVQPVLDVKDKPKPAQWAFLSLQHLFAMFEIGRASCRERV